MDARTPRQVAELAEEIGLAKTSLHSQPLRLAVLAILAGCYIALGGTLSLITGYGMGATASNPGLQKLVSGATFPIGLILVVVLGAELFTGNNALLVPAFMRGRYGISTVIKNWTIVYLGNFVGAVAFTTVMVWCVGLTSAEPYHSAIIGIGIAKTSMPWMTVFLKGIAANWCVCLAVWLALSGKTLGDKIAGCWWPVMAFVALGYEHCIANMMYLPLAMLEGADITVGRAIWANLIPATIGNIIGGALFVGCVHGWLHLRNEN